VEAGPGRAGSNPGISSKGVLPCSEVPTEHLTVRLVSTEPAAVTVVHHHGELDTTAYVLEGTMAFYCGRGLREVVAARAGELAFVEPHAVHAEHNPEAAGANTAIVVRDTQGPSMFPCDVPAETPGGRTGIHVVPPPVAGGALSTVAAAEALAAVAPYRLQTRRIALDRLNLAPGAAFSTDTRAVGETAVTVLRGTARIQDRDAGQSFDGATRTWWYIEPGSLWSLENPAADAMTELLLVRCVPPSSG
jgi:uncharacterized RmlC-like cupin family protein